MVSTLPFLLLAREGTDGHFFKLTLGFNLMMHCLFLILISPSVYTYRYIVSDSDLQIQCVVFPNQTLRALFYPQSQHHFIYIFVVYHCRLEWYIQMSSGFFPPFQFWSHCKRKKQRFCIQWHFIRIPFSFCRFFFESMWHPSFLPVQLYFEFQSFHIQGTFFLFSAAAIWGSDKELQKNGKYLLFKIFWFNFFPDKFLKILSFRLISPTMTHN